MGLGVVGDLGGEGGAALGVGSVVQPGKQLHALSIGTVHRVLEQGFDKASALAGVAQCVQAASGSFEGDGGFVGVFLAQLSQGVQGLQALAVLVL
jgi:hypothetical protein